MGAYLSEPVIDKVSSDETSGRLNYGASSMQGWRAFQEDAHNSIIDFDKDTSLFAVYDGHGGAEVAKYCSLNLPDYLRSVTAYKTGNLSQGLEDTFLEFDNTLTKPEVIADLKRFADLPDDDDSDDDTKMLNEEAEMPLEQVLARYKDPVNSEEAFSDVANKIAPHIKRYHNEKPKSPKLHAKKSIVNSDVATNSTTSEVGDEDSREANAESSDSATVNSINGVSSSEKQCTVPKSEVDCKNRVDDCGSSADSSDHSSKAQKEPSQSKIDADDGVSSTTLNGEGTKDAKADSCDDAQPGCSNVSSSSSLKLEKKKKKPSVEATTADANEEGSSSDVDSEDDEDFKGPESETTDDCQSGEDDDDDDDSEEDEESSEDEPSEIMMPQGDEPGQDSGCTAVVAVVRQNQLLVANAGDSRCVICRNGKALDMSIDHKPEDDIERERIRNAGGEVTTDGRVNGGLNLSRAIGDHAYKGNPDISPKEQMITALPDIKITTLEELDEFMLLACDGIWNSMSSQEVVDFVRERIGKVEKLSQICEELFDHCLAPDTTGDGTGCDNMTAIIVKFNSLTGPSGKRSADEDISVETKKAKIETESVPKDFCLVRLKE